MTSPFPLFSEQQTFADRVNGLQTAHPWMDPQVTTTLAASPSSNDELLSIGDALKKQVAQTWDGISHFFADPVLEKQQTPSMALQRYLTGASGQWPVQDTHLSHIQSELQKNGFGAGLPVDGKWDSGWQAALQQRAQQHYDEQAAGNKPGAVSSGGLLHGLLDSISPSGIASTVTGFVKSIPADVSTLVGDVWGGLATIPDSILHPISSTSDAAKAQRQQQAADFQNTIGGNAYRKSVGLPQVTAQNYDALTSGINDVGTIFLLSGLGKAGSAVAKSALKNSTEGLATRITTDEAVRGPGVIAKSLLKPVGTRIATGAAVSGAIGGAQAAARGSDIGTGVGAGIGIGAILGGLIPHRAFENMPVLGRTGPMIGRLADADGLYYTARTRLATPYQYGGTRLAGAAMTQGQAFSLKAHGVGYIQSLIGGDSDTINKAIENTDPLNGINASLRDKLAFTSAGLHFAPDLNYLMYFLHGPLKVGSEGTVSASLKSDSDQALAAMQNNGIIQQVEQGTGQSYAELLKAAGGDPNRLNVWIMDKTRQAAVHQHGEEVFNNLRTSMPSDALTIDGDARQLIIRNEASAAWNDPEKLKTAVARMQGSDENYLSTFIKSEMTGTLTKPDAYMKHGLGDRLDAGDILSHKILPFKDEHLLTPQEKTIVPGGMDPAFATPDNPFVTKVKVMSQGEVAAGAIGLARKTTLTSQAALKDLKQFTADLEPIGNDAAGLEAWSHAAHDYLFTNYGLDARKLQVLASTPEKTLNLLEYKAKQLAAEVHYAAGAPPELKQAFADIDAKGYRVVVGKDIGHGYRTDLPPIAELGAPITAARKIASNLGLNPQRFSRIDYGVDRRLQVTRALQKAVDENRIVLPRRYTVQTLLNDLQDDKIVGKQLPWFGNAMFAASRRAHRGTIEELMRLGRAEDPAQAEAVLKSQIASAGGLRDLRVKDVRRVLTRTDKVPWANAEADGSGFVTDVNTIPLMSDAHADEVFKAIQQGYSHTGAYMLGLGKIEDLVRYAPFKVGKVLHVPDNKATLALMNLPNSIARARDAYRFNLSPFFDLRRVAKANVKMGVDGVQGTLTPVKELMRLGKFDEAHLSLDRILGSQDARYKYLDEADRYLDTAGVFGLYNPRHFEAYYVAMKQAAGATDKEIHDGLIRTFHYGTDGKEGRTALERSINTVFFPFSFEKTVARNVGGYLLDKPAQAMILSNSLDAYRDFSNHHKDNPLAMTWLKTHAPLLDEVLRLNAFAHGFSLGELGGVNRPLLNAFMPQSWATNKDTVKTLNRFIPAVADLHRIIGEGTQQSKIIRQSVVNGISVIENGQNKSLLNGNPVAETDIAQRNDARIFRSTIVSAFKDVLAYNDGVQTDEEKYHFGLGPGIPDDLRGAPITKTNIGYIVQHKYPVYDPLAGAAYAIKNKHDAELYVRKTGNVEYADFYKKALTAVAHLNKDEYPDAQAAQVQDLFRQAAIDFSHKDAAFLRFYNKTFASSFGPIERVQ